MGPASFKGKITAILQTSANMSRYEHKVNKIHFPHAFKSLVELKLLFKFKKQWERFALPLCTKQR